MSSQGSEIVSNEGYMEDNGPLRDVRQNGAIHSPPIVGNVVFHVTSTMLHLLQMKGLYGRKAHEEPHDHLKNFIDVCGLLTFKNIPQESICLRLFPFSLTIEATARLGELPKDSITS